MGADSDGSSPNEDVDTEDSDSSGDEATAVVFDRRENSVPALRDECSMRGLSRNGARDVLVGRLEAADRG